MPQRLLRLVLALGVLSGAIAAGPAAAAPSPTASGSVAWGRIPPAESTGAGTVNYSLSELGGIDDIVLRGVNPSYLFFTPIPEDWRLNGVTLNLSLSHSAVLDSDSTLTVVVNNSPVSSLRLTAENAGPTNWEVDLPPDTLNKDALAVTFTGYLRVGDDVCEDLENEANWVRIASTSTVAFAFERLAFQPELARFPYPFVRTRSVTADRPLVVVPQDASTNEFLPALRVAGALGMRATWRGIALDTLPADALDSLGDKDRDLVFVGRADRLGTAQAMGASWPLTWNDGGILVDASGQPVEPDTGIIMMAASPWNPGHGVMAVTGATDAAVSNATSALAQSTFANLARGAYALIPTPPQDNSAGAAGSSQAWEHTTLAALGYPTQTVRGLGKHNLSYTLDLPSSRLPESLKAFVAYSHSPLVSTEQSFLVLSINGIPQGGVYLNQEDGRIGLWEVTIPADQLRPGRNSMDLLFELYPIDDSPCDDLYLDRAWGVVYAGTALQASFSEGSTRPDLSILPAPFDSGTVVVLPNRLGAEGRAASFRLFAELGSRMGARAQGMQIVTADQVSEEMLKGRHVILIGQPDGNPWLAAAMPLGPVKFDGGLRSLQADKVNLSLADGEAVGLLEVFVSPWDAAHAALVITGTSDAAVGWASDLLSDPVTSAGLRGDVAIVDSRGTLTAFDSRGPVTPSNPLVADESAMRWVQIGLIAFFGLLALALLVVLVIRRRSR